MVRKIKYFFGLVIFFSFSFVRGQKEPTIEYSKEFINSLENSKEEINQNLSLDTFKQRFAFLNRNTSLSIEYNPITYGYTKKYLSYSWYGRIIGVSSYYFPFFEKKLTQYGLPKELKYLAVVESALNPRAISNSGAKGLWQFMPATGAEMGIRKNDYVDIFFDPVGNTDSACRYLKKLFLELGDWNLAISAYNCGVGNVKKAIKKVGSKNYWKIRPFLPKETQAYVPSFIAVNYMFNFYRSHNIKPQYFKYSFLDFSILKITRNTTFTAIGKVFNPTLLTFANPQILTNFIPKGAIIYVYRKNKNINCPM